MYADWCCATICNVYSDGISSSRRNSDVLTRCGVNGSWICMVSSVPSDRINVVESVAMVIWYQQIDRGCNAKYRRTRKDHRNCTVWSKRLGDLTIYRSRCVVCSDVRSFSYSWLLTAFLIISNTLENAVLEGPSSPANPSVI